MQNVNIQTAQNVGIQYEIAGIGLRMGAFAIDMVVIVAYIIGMVILLDLIDLQAGWVMLMFYLPVFFYHFLCEVFFEGQSIGKRQLNIKVVKLDGTPPTLGGYFLRWILRPIDILIFSGGIGVLSILMTKNSQRVGDIAAGTTVVKVGRKVHVEAHEIIKTLEEDYKVSFPEVSRLSDKQIDIIKQALAVNKRQANIKPVLAITNKTKEFLEIQSDLPPVKFLYTVVKDYKYLTSKT